MTTVRKLVATLGLVGLGAAATSAVGLPNQLDAFALVHQDPALTMLDVVAPPELAGAVCTILDGPAFCVGMPVGSVVLVPGHNLIAVPNLPGDGVYTAIGPFEAKPLDDNDCGAN